jgi:hypothetical protein
MSYDGTGLKATEVQKNKIREMIAQRQFGSPAEKKTVIEHLREAENRGDLPLGYLTLRRTAAVYQTDGLSAIIHLDTGEWFCQGVRFSGGVKAFINWWKNRTQEIKARSGG